MRERILISLEAKIGDEKLEMRRHSTPVSTRTPEKGANAKIVEILRANTKRFSVITVPRSPRIRYIKY